MARKILDLAGRQLRHMHGGQVRSQQPQTLEACEWTLVVHPPRFFDLESGLVDMAMHAQA